MERRVRRIPVGVLALTALSLAQAPLQNPAPGGWRAPDWNKPPITAANRKPAPRRSLTGMWAPAEGPGAGTQAQGVQLKPNNGRPENELPVHAVRPATLPIPSRARRHRCGAPCPGQRSAESLRAARSAALQPLQRQADAVLPGRVQGRSSSITTTTAGASSGPTADSSQSWWRAASISAASFENRDSSATRWADGWTTTRSRSRRLARCRTIASGSIRRAGRSATRRIHRDVPSRGR